MNDRVFKSDRENIAQDFTGGIPQNVGWWRAAQGLIDSFIGGSK